VVDGEHQFFAVVAPAEHHQLRDESVPAGWTKDGLPVGLQMAGRHLDDALVLRASAAFEAATQPQKHWPPLVHACQKNRPASLK
jgi:Asp-tRNA(Asn)/Glu-tRNA(Gln) amidotransferase A subunit family amidase